MLAVIFWWPTAPREAPLPTRQTIIRPGPERLTLGDGSVVELNRGAQVEVRFSDTERRVLLRHGEAVFLVAKNSGRPFIVAAGEVAVRAVGTAFSVALGEAQVAVLVTEGRVRLDQAPTLADPAGEKSPQTPDLVAGQRAVITTAVVPNGPQLGTVQVSKVTSAEVERTLAWQRMRLEFVEVPLAEIVAEFNRYNHQQLVVVDAETAALLIGGNFRADNVEAFVRLLESSFGVTSSRNGDKIVLRKSK